MFRKLIAPAALACLALGATQANADTVRVDGFAGGYETLTISLFAPNAAKSEFGEAGGLATTLVGVGSFTAYCADLYQNISLNTTYTGFTPVAGSAHTFANANANNDLGKLFSEGVVLNSATSQAAFN